MIETQSISYQFSIVVPAYNEENSIDETVRTLLELRTKYLLNCEIIIINDGSTDKTSERLDAIKNIPGIKIINNRVNIGYGASLKRGISIAKSDIICITDADGSYPVDRIPEMVKYMNEFDMVVGARQGKYYWGSFFKNPSRKLFLMMIHYITGERVPDGNSGLRVFRKSKIMEFFNLIGNKFSFTTSLTLASHYSGHAVKYIPIQYNKRVGKTKVRHIRDSIGVIQLMLQVAMYFDPFKVVFPVFILSCLIGALSFASLLFGAGGVWLLVGFMSVFFAISVLFFGLLSWLIIALIKKLH